MITPDTYMDFHGFSQLKTELGKNQDADAVVKEVANQFEAIFLQMMLKSMRSASIESELMDSDLTNQYRDILDSQLAITLSQNSGIGIAEIIEQQITGMMRRQGVETAGERGTETAVEKGIRGHHRADSGGTVISPQDFIRELQPLAESTGYELGIDAGAILAQAALETGWGRSIIRHPDGRSSYNIFGIKAGTDWPGNTVQHLTLEHENGRLVKRTASFRSYQSYAEAFDDYKDLLGNPRYAGVVAEGRDKEAFGYAMQKAGYATDPEYGEKIMAVLRGNHLQLAMAENK